MVGKPPLVVLSLDLAIRKDSPVLESSKVGDEVTFWYYSLQSRRSSAQCRRLHSNGYEPESIPDSLSGSDATRVLAGPPE
jgi:hypothetical protein